MGTTGLGDDFVMFSGLTRVAEAFLSGDIMGTTVFAGIFDFLVVAGLGFGIFEGCTGECFLFCMGGVRRPASWVQ